MIKRRSNGYGKIMSDGSTSSTTSFSGSRGEDEKVEWEMRPGGMLVQKRKENIDVPPSNLRLRISYGALSYEISVNSSATFGEVKKHLTAQTGLQPSEQKLLYRGKEREDRVYLDTCGIKDKSRIILTEDPCCIEKRYIEMRKNAKIQSVHRAISNVSMEVDRLAEQVSAIEKSVSNGIKEPEVQITTLIEMLMRQAIKLDSINTEDGEASAQKRLESKRVQKCVESLDVLKASNARIKPAVVTTKWETFDPPPNSTSQWEFFD